MWENDARLMSEVGMNVVRMAVFAILYFFLLNHNASNVEVVLPREYIDAILGKSLKGKIVIEPYGVRILQ